jgi:hypothetical protein
MAHDRNIRLSQWDTNFAAVLDIKLRQFQTNPRPTWDDLDFVKATFLREVYTEASQRTMTAVGMMRDVNEVVTAIGKIAARVNEEVELRDMDEEGLKRAKVEHGIEYTPWNPERAAELVRLAGEAARIAYDQELSVQTAPSLAQGGRSGGGGGRGGW